MTKRLDRKRSADSNPLVDQIVNLGGFLITAATRLVGIWIAIKEASHPVAERDAIVFAFAAFMMAGATGLDNLVDRFFAPPAKPNEVEK